MSDEMRHVRKLADEIGPRPAGTNEEQMASEYIAAELKERGLRADIEEFTCSMNTSLATIVCYILTAVGALFSNVNTILSVIAFVLALAGFVLLVHERSERGIISGLNRGGLSQNVVARYVPEQQEAGRRMRPVVIIAHYDSQKNALEGIPAISRLYPYFRIATFVGSALVALICFLQVLPLPFSDTGNAIIWLLTIICALPAIAGIVATVIRRFVLRYADGANDNASGVAAMLGIADRVFGYTPIGESIPKRPARPLAADALDEAEDVAAPVEVATAPEVAEDVEAAEPVEAIAPAIRRHTKEQILASGVVPAGVSLLVTAEAEEAAVRDARRADAADRAARAMVAQAQKSIEASAPADVTGVVAPIAVAEPADATAEQPVVEVEVEAEPAAEPAPEVAAETARVIEFAPQPEPEPEPEPAKPAQGRYASHVARVQEALEPEDPERVSQLRSHAQAVRLAERRKREAALAAAEQSGVESEQTSGMPSWWKREDEEQPRRERTATGTVRSRYADIPSDNTFAAAARAAAARAEARRRGVALEAEEPVTEVASEVVAEAVEAEVEGAPVESQADAAPAPSGFAAQLAAARAKREQAEAPEPEADEAAAAAAAEAEERARAEAELEAARLAAVEKAKAEAEAERRAAEERARIEAEEARRRAREEAEAARLAAEEEAAAEKAKSEAAALIEQARAVQAERERSAMEAEAERRAAIAAAAVQREANLDAQAEAELGRIISMNARPASLSEPASPDATSALSAPVDRFTSPDLQMPESAFQPSSDVFDPFFNAQPLDASSHTGVAVPQAVIDPSLSSKMRRIGSVPGIDPTGEQPAVEADPFAARERSYQTPQAVTVPPSESAQLRRIRMANDPSGQFTVVQGGASDAALLQGTGTFAPVGDPYATGGVFGGEVIDDADDERTYNETPANMPASSYVDIPESRTRRFFDRLSDRLSGRRSDSDDQTMNEWLDVDEDFNARDAGREIGSWDRFEEDDDEWKGGGSSTRGYRDGQGQGASRVRQGRINGRAIDTEAQPESVRAVPGRGRRQRPEYEYAAEDVAVLQGADEHKAPEYEEPADDAEIREKVIERAHADLADREIWFVALGASGAAHAGAREFIAKHGGQISNALVINIEGVGLGELSCLVNEGLDNVQQADRRLAGMIAKASRKLGLPVRPRQLRWRTTDATPFLERKMRAATLMGFDGDAPGNWRWGADSADSVDAIKIAQAADLVAFTIKGGK